MPSLIPVDDPTDERLAPFRGHERALATRTQRRDDGGDGLFLAEGDLVVERALDAGCVPVAALVDRDRPPAVAARLVAHIDVFTAGDTLRAAATRLGAPATAIAVFTRPPRPSIATLTAAATRLVVIEAVDNPVNVGGIVRNAAGLGWDGLILDATSADPLARRALRVSMGHALRLPHARTPHLEATLLALAHDGWGVIALTPADDSLDLGEVATPDRIALVVGSERAGLTPAVIAAATARVRIPMRAGVDSLNAAAATAVACWQLRRR